MLCLNGFKLYSRWVLLIFFSPYELKTQLLDAKSAIKKN